MHISERRRHPRYQAQHRVTLTLPDGCHMQASTLDISNQGACIYLAQPIPANIPVLVEFKHTEPHMQLWANTLHNNKELGIENEGDGSYRLGLEYKKTPSRYKGMLLALAPQQRLN